MSLGMTGQNMIDDVSNALNLTTAQLAEVLRFLNRSALDMAEVYDWPELRVNDGSFTTDGSDSYDLTAAGKLGATFLRVIDKSVRVGTRNLLSKPKSFMDEVDPARQTSSTPLYYCFVMRTDFRLMPYGSDGDTVYLDWIRYPAEITAALTAAQQTYMEPRQELVVEGAIWRGERRLGLPRWEDHKEIWERSVRKSFDKGSIVRVSPRQVHANHPWTR